MANINASIKAIIGQSVQTDEYVCETLKESCGYDYPTIDSAIEKMVEEGTLVESQKECGEFGMVSFLSFAK
jgi:hypothetical protein